jgi:hypothetical protein
VLLSQHLCQQNTFQLLSLAVMTQKWLLLSVKLTSQLFNVINGAMRLRPVCRDALAASPNSRNTFKAGNTGTAVFMWLVIGLEAFHKIVWKPQSIY